MSERLFLQISFLISFVFFTALALHITGLLEALIISIIITMLGGVLAGSVVLTITALLIDYLKWIVALIYSNLHQLKS